MVGLDEIDWEHCPHCGEELILASVELIEGFSPIDLRVDDQGGLTASWEGCTDMQWDSSTTTYYLCRTCYESLPENMQQRLDALLHNKRWEVRWTYP